MEYLYIGIWIIHLALYSQLNGIHVQYHAISRCVDDTCESGIGVYPHCTECNKFIYCIFGYAVERTCPENLLFDITYGICNFPKNAKCWNSISLRPGRTGIERTFNKHSENKRDKTLDDTKRLLNINDKVVKVKDSNSKLKVTLKSGDLPEEVTLNTDDPPKDVTLNTNDPPEDVTLKTDDPPQDVTLNTNDPPEDVTLKTDDPPEDVTLNTDDPPIDVTLKTDDPPEDVTLKTDDPPEDVTLNTNDPPEDVTLKTDDPPEDVTLNTNDPPEDVTLNTDDPPEDATISTGDPLEEAKMKSGANEVIKTAEPKNDLKEQQPKGTMDTDDPPEEWNREYSINPDFPQNQNPAEGNTGFKTKNQDDKQLAISSNDVPKVQVPCVKDCNGMSEGNYQSCDSCSKYVSCMWGMKLDNTCVSGLYWDDITKKCVTHSTTC